jgi:hypothetical protein
VVAANEGGGFRSGLPAPNAAGVLAEGAYT